MTKTDAKAQTNKLNVTTTSLIEPWFAPYELRIWQHRLRNDCYLHSNSEQFHAAFYNSDFHFWKYCP